MVSTGKDDQGILFDLIYQAVRSVDSSRPAAGEIVLEGFWLPLSGEGIPEGIFNQGQRS